MSNEDIRRKNAELAEIATQLRIVKPGNRSLVDRQVKHLIEELLFLDKEPGCSEAVEAVQANIKFLYMEHVDELKLAESIEKLVEKLKNNIH